MADGPASARERAEAGTPLGTRLRLRPLTDEEYAAQHADAVWSDVRSTHYGRAELRRHRPVLARPAWRFPYYDRVYVAHRYYAAPAGDRSVEEGGVWDITTAPGWSVSLWLAPWADEALGLPRDAATAPVIHLPPEGPLLTGAPILRDAVRGLALKLVTTPCDHGYGRGRDSCPGCDMLDDLYDDLP
jgi:hypothetical protein